MAFSTCPNAAEDVVVERSGPRETGHDAWRSHDPRDSAALHAIAETLTPEGTGAQPLPTTLVRALYQSEAVGAEVFTLYDLASELDVVKRTAESRAGRRGGRLGACQRRGAGRARQNRAQSRAPACGLFDPSRHER